MSNNERGRLWHGIGHVDHRQRCTEYVLHPIYSENRTPPGYPENGPFILDTRARVCECYAWVKRDHTYADSVNTYVGEAYRSREHGHY